MGLWETSTFSLDLKEEFDVGMGEACGVAAALSCPEICFSRVQESINNKCLNFDPFMGRFKYILYM